MTEDSIEELQEMFKLAIELSSATEQLLQRNRTKLAIEAGVLDGDVVRRVTAASSALYQARVRRMQAARATSKGT